MNNFTLIIPTHNRHIFLKRLLDYYEKENIIFNIIIVDSSEISFKEMSTSKQFIYKHCNNMAFKEKIYFALNMVNTKFVAICADDDFMIPTGIDKSCDFLDKNEHYTSIQGKVIRFETKNPILYSVDESNVKSINYINYKERILYGLVTNYTQTFYSIHKTEVLKDIFYQASKINYYLIELFVTISTYLYGQHKVISSLYYMREEHKISEGKNTVGVEQFVVYKKDKYKKDYDTLLNVIDAMIQKYDNKSYDNKKFISDIINSYLINFDENIFIREKKYKLYLLLRNILRPFYVKIFFFWNYLKLKIYKDIVHKEKYTFSDEKEKIELRKVEFFIKKYNIQSAK